MATFCLAWIPHITDNIKSKIFGYQNIKKLIKIAALAVLVVLLCLFFKHYKTGIGSGTSMAPTLGTLNVQLYDKEKTPAYGDIVAITLDKDNLQFQKAYASYGRTLTQDEKITKRVIACPGDDIRVDGNDVYVNGEKMDTSFWSGSWDSVGKNMTYVYQFEQKNIPGYWVIGDNRQESFDSRALGFIPAECVTGVSVWQFSFL